MILRMHRQRRPTNRKRKKKTLHRTAYLNLIMSRSGFESLAAPISCFNHNTRTLYAHRVSNHVAHKIRILEKCIRLEGFLVSVQLFLKLPKNGAIGWGEKNEKLAGKMAKFIC